MKPAQFLVIAATSGLAVPATANPIITEVGWAGSTTSADDEWIEIHNPDATPICDLSAFSLVQGTTTRPLPVVALPARGFLVFERRPSSTALDAPAALALSFGAGLTNTGQPLRLCPAASVDPGQAAACDVVNPDPRVAWFAGVSSSNDGADRTMERVSATAVGTVAASWASSTSETGTPGTASFAGVVGDLSACNGGGEGEGEPVGEGEGEPVGEGEGEPVGEGEGESFVYSGLAITEIFFNPSDGSQGKEWVEVGNLSDRPIDLATSTLEKIATSSGVVEFSTALGTGTLFPGERIVVAREADLGVGLCAQNVVVAGLTLPNSGKSLRVVGDGFTNTVAYGGSGAALDPFRGASRSLRADNLDNRVAANFVPAVCSYGGGERGSPGVANSFDSGCGAPTFLACLPDAGVSEGEGEVDPFAYDGLAVTEIHYNPTGSEAGKEWFEIANLSANSISLQSVVVEIRLDGVVERTISPGPGVLDVGERLVFARDADLGIEGLCLQHVVVVDGLSLLNSEQRVIRVSGPGFDNSVSFGGSSSTTGPFDGRAQALVRDDLDNSLAGSFAPAPCAYFAGDDVALPNARPAAFGSPGVANPAAGDCDDDLFVACAPDGGVAEGEGEQSDAGFADAGPNDSPTIELTAPTGNVEIDDDGALEVTYNADDNDGVASVDIYLAIDDDGQDGIRVARGLPAGSKTRTVSTLGVPPGTWHVFALARDDRGAVAYDYAPGTVDVGGGGAVEAAFRLDEPDGIDDVADDGLIEVTWSADLPSGKTGTIALFADVDDDRRDGIPLVAGLPAVSLTDTAVPKSFTLDTGTLEPGTYFIYGTLSHDGDDITSLADGVITVSGGACTCQTVSASRAAFGWLPGALVVAMLGTVLGMVRRRASPRSDTVALTGGEGG